MWKRRLYVALTAGSLAFGVLADAIPGDASIHVVSNSECSNGNLAKSQNPPGQAKNNNRAASVNNHKDPAEEC